MFWSISGIQENGFTDNPLNPLTNFFFFGDDMNGIKIGFSKRNKDYLISKSNIYNWLNQNTPRLFDKAYRKSKSNKTDFLWLSGILEDSYYEIDLDNSFIVIDLGFMKIRSDFEIVEIR